MYRADISHSIWGHTVGQCFLLHGCWLFETCWLIRWTFPHTYKAGFSYILISCHSWEWNPNIQRQCTRCYRHKMGWAVCCWLVEVYTLNTHTPGCSACYPLWGPSALCGEAAVIGRTPPPPMVAKIKGTELAICHAASLPCTLNLSCCISTSFLRYLFLWLRY